MDRHQASEWMEQWADRHGVRLEELRRYPASWSVAGLVRQIWPGQVVSCEAMAELLEKNAEGNGQQLMWSQEGQPLPPTGGPLGGSGGGQEEVKGTKPPGDNMGGKLTTEPLKGFEVGTSGLEAAVDWVNGVGKGEAARDRAKAAISRRCGQGQARLGGIHSYTEGWQWDSGAILVWSPGREDWLLSVNGRTLELVGAADHLGFLAEVDSLVDHVTRLDVRLDDRSRQLLDLEKIEAARRACNFTGFRVCGRQGDDHVIAGRLLPLGATITFGRRGKMGSGCYVRAYDKGLESKGRINAIRLEVERTKEKANVAWRSLVDAIAVSEDTAVMCLGQLVTGAVDFVQRGQAVHVERMPRLDWWASIVEQVGRVVVRFVRPLVTLQQSANSALRQYGSKLKRAFVVAKAKGYSVEGMKRRLVDFIDGITGQDLDDREISPLEALLEPAALWQRAT